jgi:hypothetical protein
MAALHGPLYSHPMGCGVDGQGAGVNMQGGHPLGPLHFDSGWGRARVDQSVSIYIGDIGGGGIFEKKTSNVGSNIVAALGIFALHSLISNIASIDTASACLLEPLNTMQIWYTGHSKKIFPKMKLLDLSLVFYIHVSVSDLYMYVNDRSAYSAAGK